MGKALPAALFHRPPHRAWCSSTGHPAAPSCPGLPCRSFFKFPMLGSTTAPSPSPHRDRPSGILDGDVDTPPPPSHAEEIVAPSRHSPSGAGISSPSTNARPSPFLSSKNKGHVPSEEIAQAAGDSSTKDSLQGVWPKILSILMLSLVLNCSCFCILNLDWVLVKGNAVFLSVYSTEWNFGSVSLIWLPQYYELVGDIVTFLSVYYFFLL
jgi:hypothetical protein